MHVLRLKLQVVGVAHVVARSDTHAKQKHASDRDGSLRCDDDNDDGQKVREHTRGIHRPSTVHITQTRHKRAADHDTHQEK